MRKIIDYPMPFGIKTIDKSNELKELLVFSYENGEEHLSNQLLGNEFGVSYFVALDKIPTFIFIDKSHAITKIPLDPKYRIYSYAFFEDYMLISAEIFDDDMNNEIHTCLITMDFEGNIISEIDAPALYSLSSIIDNIALGIDSSFNLQQVKIIENEIEIIPLVIEGWEENKRDVEVIPNGKNYYIYYSKTNQLFSVAFE